MSNVDQAVDVPSISQSAPSTTTPEAEATQKPNSNNPVAVPNHVRVPPTTLPVGFVRTLLYILHESLHAGKQGADMIFITGPLRKTLLRIPFLHRLKVTNQEAIWIHWLYHKNILPHSLMQQPRIQDIVLLQAKPRLKSEFLAEMKKMEELRVQCPVSIAEARRDPRTAGYVVITPDIKRQLENLAIRMSRVDEYMRLVAEKRRKVRHERSMALFNAWKDRPERFQRPKDTPRERLKAQALEKSLRDEHPESQERPATPTPSPKSLASNKENNAPFNPWAPHPTDSNPAPKRELELDSDATVLKDILAQTQSCAPENVMFSTSPVKPAPVSIPTDGNPQKGPAETPHPIPALDNQPRSDHKRKHEDVGEGDDRPLKKGPSSSSALIEDVHEKTQEDVGKESNIPWGKCQSSSSTARVGDQPGGEHKRKRDKDVGEGDARPSKKSRPSPDQVQPILKKLEVGYTVPWETYHRKWPVALRQLDGARARKLKRSLKKQPVAVLKMATNLQLSGQLPEAMHLPYMPKAHIWTTHQQMCWKWYCRVSGIPVVKAHRKGSSLRFEVNLDSEIGRRDSEKLEVMI